MKKFAEKINSKEKNRGFYLAVISSVALSCGGTAWSQTNNVPVANATSGSSTNVTDLGNVTVIGKLDQARNQIIPDLGATAYTINKDQIASVSQGDNAPFNEILLRAPGVAQDSSANGDLHVRGEHANLQYRINDVLLPEGITGFGLELDPRFVESMQLVTGSLPAAYGFRTAGVVDIQTKNGGFENGGEASIYGGSHDTVIPNFEYSGTSGQWNYFTDGSYNHNSLGIENPTPSANAIHDNTDQFRTFNYASYIIDPTSRLTFMGSAEYSNFEVPNTPGLPVGTSPDGSTAWNVPGSGLPANFNSANLNEQQREQNYYAVAAYQKSAGNFNGQLSAYGRMSGVHFMPDQTGDLYFNGVSSDVNRKLYSEGLQADGSYDLGESHTIRSGGMLLNEVVFSETTSTVFPVDSSGNPTGAPENITDNTRQRALFVGGYLQDEWKMFSNFTVNFGSRVDAYTSSFDSEYQISPRVNLIYKPTDTTTLHAGYSRYFTPPPLENVSGNTIAKFAGTSNEASVTNNIGSAKAERANYFDAGISQQLAPGLTVGVDGYYKTARQQLDDGLFGQTLILQSFNYARGKIYGIEPTVSYTHGGFSSYANIAWSVAQGENWDSAQYLFDPADLAYVKHHYIYLDHDQRVTGSFGLAYTWKEGDHGASRFYMDALYGTGLRTDSSNASGDTIPNGGSVPAYYSINLGAEQVFKLPRKQALKARFDIVNLTDNSYALRDGSGVGVNAAQYGARIGFFGGLTYVF
jgi:outer membrane receptor protein involved in Fe transport